jgi:branched-chain amino acid transport system permease protein
MMLLDIPPITTQIVEQLAAAGLLNGAVYGLMAVGLTLIFGVMRVINFAHGNMIVLAMYATISIHNRLHLDPYIALVIVVPLFFVAGMVLYQVILQPLVKRGSTHTNQVVATLGVALILTNALILGVGATSRFVVTSYSTSSVMLGTVSISTARLYAFAASLVSCTLFFLLLRYTYTGMAIRGTAQDRQAAELVGISTKRINLLAFGLGTAAAGVAGAVITPFYFVNPNVDISLSLTAYVIVVLGGLGSMTGALIGGLLIGLIESFTGFYFDPQVAGVAYLLVFVLVLIVRPSGLLGVRGYEALDR